MKRWFFVILAFTAFPLWSFMAPETDPHRIDKIILDAGHGGEDPGNLGTGRYATTEKDVALEVTLMVGRYIEENLPGVEVIYTRSNDRFLKLYERTAIANREKGDIFISIHCNAFSNPASHGTETFTIGMHRTEGQLQVAQRENSVILLEEDYKETYKDFDPSDPNTYIGLGLVQNAYNDQSIRLAERIQSQFRDRLQRVDRGVKQAGFYVISKTIMPSVLVELGFLTNANEEDYLHSNDGKVFMASAIYRAIRDFKNERESAVQTSPGAGVEGVSGADGPNKSDVRDEPSTDAQASTQTQHQSNPRSEKPRDSAGNAIPETDSALDVSNNINLNISVGDSGSSSTPEIPYLTVQFLTSGNPNRDLQSFGLSDLGPTGRVPIRTLTGYYCGRQTNLKEAEELKQKLMDRGFKDAFIIGVHRGERISVEKALMLLEN